MDLYRTTIAIVSIVASFAVATPAAATSSGDRGEALIASFLTDVETFSATFRQSMIDAEGAVQEQTGGTLEIRRPGRFRWEYNEPYEQWLVADGDNIWSYDVDLEQVTVKPQAEALANTPALLLGGSDDALDGFEFQGSYEDGGLTWVRLVPDDTDSGFLRVELGFDGEMLDRMVFFDNLDQTTFVALSDTVVNGEIDPGRFRFDVPDGVDVVGVPVPAKTTD